VRPSKTALTASRSIVACDNRNVAVTYLSDRLAIDELQ